MNPGTDWRLTPRQRVLLGVWVVASLGLIYSRGLEVEVDRHVTSRLRFHAIPAAISVLYHGWPHDYTAARDLALNFQGAGAIEEKIAWAVDTQLPPKGAVYYWAADDRGMADYVIGAFALFGPSVKSLYRFYFVVLAVSILLFIIDLGAFASAAGVLVLLLGAVYACIPVIPLSGSEPGALFEPRLVELLALVSSVHLMLASFMGGKWTAARTAVIGAQAAIVAACYHARSSVGWEVAAVLAAGVVMWLLAWWTRRRRPTEATVAPAYAMWPAACLVIALAGMTAYQHYAFNPRYFEDQGARTVWHNALMGYSVNAELRDKYQLAVADKNAVEAVIAYRAQQGASAGPPWVLTDILNSLGGHTAFDWFEYERVARSLYWHIWRTDTASAWRCYLIDKPKAIAAVIAGAWKRDAAGGPDRGLYFNPFSPAGLLIVMPGFLLLLGNRLVVDSRLTILLLLLGGSVIPGLLFYPQVHTMIGAFALVAVSIYLAIAYGIGAVMRFRAKSDGGALRRLLARGLASNTTRQRVLLTGWVVASLALIYSRGVDLQVDRQVTSRLRFHAIPAAMSVMYHGRPHDYTASNAIAMHFQNSGPIEEKIAWAVDAKLPAGDPVYYWAADDRGMADYVIGAFTLFGPSVKSLYRFYFLVLSVSILLFIIDLGALAPAAGVLVLLLGALYACLPVIPLGDLTIAVFEPGALFEPRLIELLALVATVHLVLASFMGGKWTAARTAVIGAQAAIVAACYHARSSVTWEVAAVLAAGVVMWLLAWWTRRQRPAESIVAPAYAMWPAACLVIALAGVTAYQHYAFHPRYFQDQGARTVWHNALMGFGFNARLSDKYRLAIDDRKAIEAVVAHRAQLETSVPWEVDTILGSLGGHTSFDWFAYERAARSLYWHIWRTDTASAWRCYLVDKPWAIATVIVKAWSRDVTRGRDTLGLYFNPFSLAGLLMVMPGFLLLLGNRLVLDSRLTILLVLLAGSVIPALLFYPVVHTMMGAFALVALSIYLTVAYGIGAVMRSRAESGVAAEPVTTSPARNVRLELGLAIGLAIVTLLVAGYFAPRGFRAGFTDLAHDGYQLRQILDLHRGGVIFKDSFDQYGPLGPYLNLAGFRLLGETLLAVKYAHCAWYAAAALLLYVLARQLLSPLLSAGSVILWLSLAPFYQHGIMVSPHTYILFFQIVGVLALIRFARSNRLREIAIAGVCAGLCWALKTSMGVTFAAGVALYLLVRWLRGLESSRRSAAALATLLLSMATIVGGALAALWAAGALDDWYIQTIAFPRAFYFEGQVTGLLGPLGQLSRFAFDFMLLNFSVTGVSIPAYWHILRATVVITACVLAWRRQAPEALLVIACVTPLLWVAAYPSANFMHQWWTVSLAIPAFAYCVDAILRWLSARWSRTRGISTLVPTMTVLVLVFFPGISARAHAAGDRAANLSERIAEPAVLAGIYTDPATAEAFQAIYGAMRNFKQHHPDVRVVSNDHCDGMTNCVAESLLWLSFLDDNTHPHPVFWPLPVLTTDLYPTYREEFRRLVRESKPLIVDSWYGPPLADNGIEGYQLLVGVRFASAYWYLFAPSHPEAVAHGEHTVRIDHTDTLPGENINSAGGRRLLFENAKYGPTGEIVKLPLYSWPSHVEVPRILTPEPLDGYATSFVSAITAVDEGRFTLRGPAGVAITNHLLFKKQPARSRDYLVVTGRVASGECQFSLATSEGAHLGYTYVNKPGPFLLMMVAPEAGHYGLEVGCSDPPWWEPLLEQGVRAIPNAVRGIRPPLDLTLDSVGWVRHDAAGPVLYDYQPSSPVVTVDIFGEGPEPENEGGVASAASETGVPAYQVFDVRAGRSRPAETYSWPRDVPFPDKLPSIQPAEFLRIADTVSYEDGTWVMNGPVRRSGSDLLRFGLHEVRPGDTFAATGVLQEGGIGIAVVRSGITVGDVAITKPGWFAVALRMPDSGDYEIVVDGRASAPLPQEDPDWVPRSRFRIQSAGWAVDSRGSSSVPGTRLVFDLENKLQRRATTYTWPLTHSFPETISKLRPLETANVLYRAPVLVGDGSKWTMAGQADSPTAYLLESTPLRVRKGGQFIAVGKLESGGLTIGVLNNNAWLGFRNIVEPGWFAAAIQVPEDGDYTLVIANNLKAPDATAGRSLLNRLGLGAPKNRFQISYSGWLDQ